MGCRLSARSPSAGQQAPNLPAEIVSQVARQGRRHFHGPAQVHVPLREPEGLRGATLRAWLDLRAADVLGAPEALTLADRVAVMRDGTIEDVRPPMRVYQEPATAFTQRSLARRRSAWPGRRPGWGTGDKIIIDFGSQRVDLAWASQRSESLTPYHAHPVLLVIRPTAPTPSRAGQGGPHIP